MKPMHKNEENQEMSSRAVITPFLRWFLLKETLAKDEVVAKLLNEMDQGSVLDQERWAESIRRALLPHVIQVLSGLLERPLKTEEMRYVFGKIDEFIALYGGGPHPGNEFCQN